MKSKKQTDTSKRPRFPYTYRSKFRTSRNVSKFVSALGWVVVIIGIITLFYGLSGLKSNPFATLSITSGFGMAISGFLFVILGQIQRATVDAADFAGELLAIEKFKLWKELEKTKDEAETTSTE